MDRKMVHIVAFSLTVLGALNWGLVAVAGFNAVETLLGVGTTLSQLAYILVGASAVYTFVTHKADCKVCK